MNGAVVLFVGFLMPLAALWLFVLWIRPAVARARVEREAMAIRNRVVDGILAEEIDPDDPRAADLLKFCGFLANNSRQLSLLAAFSAAVGMERAGVDLQADAERVRASRKLSDATTAAGARRIQEAEHELDKALANFFVDGSAFWWILAPSRRLTRFARSRRLTTPQLDTHKPGELATDVREASRGRATPPDVWTVHGRGVRLA